MACSRPACLQLYEGLRWLSGFLLWQAVQELKGQLPIERARMRLKVAVPVTCRQDLMQLLASKQASIESQDLGLHNNQVRACLLPRFISYSARKCVPVCFFPVVLITSALAIPMSVPFP